MSVTRYVLELQDKLTGPLKGAASEVHKAAAEMQKLTEQTKRMDGAADDIAKRFGRIEVSADGTAASIDGMTLSAAQLNREARKVEAETAKVTRGWDRAADALDKLAGSAGVTADQQELLRKRAAQVREEGTRLTAEAREQAQALRVVADATAAEAAASKQAQKEARAEARERDKLIRQLERQQQADERVRLGKEQAQAVQEIRAIEDLQRELRQVNLLREEENDLLERRKNQIRENLAIETSSLAKSGARFDRGMGARGTRRSPAGAGVFSSRMDQFGSQIRDLEDSAGDADSIIMALSSALSNVSPEAAQAGQALGDVSAALEALLRIAGGKGAVVLGGLAIVAGTIATAYVTWKNASDRVAEAQGRLNARVEEGRKRLEAYQTRVTANRAALAQFRRGTGDIDLDLAILTGEAGEEQVGFRDIQRRISEESDAALRDASLVVAERENELAALQKIATATTVNNADRKKAVEEIAKAEAGLARAQAEVAQIEADREERLDKATDLLIEQTRQRREQAALSDSGGSGGVGGDSVDATAAASAVAEAARIADAAEAKRLTGVEAINDKYDDQIDAVNRLRAALEGLGAAQAQAAQAEIDRATAAIEANREAELAAEARRQAEIRASLGRVTTGASAADLNAALQAQNEALAAQSADRDADARARQGAAVATAGNAAVGLLQGDLIGGLGAVAGPVGAGLAVAGAIGEMGADGVEDAANAQIDSIVAGIEALPRIIAEVLPDAVIRLGTELPMALVDAAPALGAAIAVDLPMALIEGLGPLVTSLLEAIVRLPIEFIKGVVEAVRELLNKLNPFGGNTTPEERAANRQEMERQWQASLAAHESGDLATQANPGGVGTFRSGTSLVPQDGVYRLHQGEAVVPVSGQASQAVRDTIRRSAPGSGGGPRVRAVEIEAVVMGVRDASSSYGRLGASTTGPAEAA